MADANDLSDLKATNPSYAELPLTQLPIRGEKRLVPSFKQISSLQSSQNAGTAANGKPPASTPVSADSFHIAARLKPFVDYIQIRILNRGQTATESADPNSTATFRFLINPSDVQISKQTVDYQALTRGGWQFGLWGEDLTHINLSGKTAGQYFSLGLTDAFREFSESWRNVEQLTMVFENNGYWFEGEEAGEGPLAGGWTRRAIKMHQDVELIVGNFIWSGMFENLEVNQDAETPFLADFRISFVAWKERYRSSSPYKNSVANNVQPGNSYSAFQAAGSPASSSSTTSQPAQSQPATSAQPANTPQNISPAAQGAQAENFFPSVDPLTFDTTTPFTLNPTSSGLF